MPIKLPKGFPRRKSSGNVLDEVSRNNDHQDSSNHKNVSESSSSFRVLARPNSTGRSLDSGNALRPAAVGTPAHPKSSFEEDSEDLFSVVRNDATNRGSGGTSNSLSTALYDSAASSTRLSSSSTNPSSLDTNSARNIKPSKQRIYEDVPPPPPPPPHSSKGGFLKNAGRTFSFGVVKSASRDKNELPPLPSDASRQTTLTTPRERAMTASSVTTATPPRLDDSSFSIKEADDDDFGNMFASIQTKSNREHFASTSTTPTPLKAEARVAPLRPIHVNSAADVDSSFYSWNSQTSKEGVNGTASPARTVTQPSPSSTMHRHTAIDSIRSDPSLEENMFEDSPLRRSPEPTASKSNGSPVARAPPPPPPSSFPSAPRTRARTQSNSNSSIQHSTVDASEFTSPPVDAAFLANAQLATRYEEKQNSPVMQSSKVMTPAEFERYKQQKEDTRRYNRVFGKAESDDGSGDDYEDDEEDEQARERQAVQQRKKQEAHLAVYRQQMMKVTGDAPNVEQPHPGTGLSTYQAGNSSSYDLSTVDRRMSQMTVDAKPLSPSLGRLPIDDEEEDEDVPLGILAAHGFPNKNRPPTRLMSSHSNPNLRNLTPLQGGASVSGAETNRGSLPAFARHLPADPYYGSSIVHQAERASLGMHLSSSQTHLATQPQPSGSSTAHPLHPAGLVGVIAGEERARAMRRGSPNPQGGYDMPMGAPQQIPNFPQGMMMQPPMMTPTEQAQMQMSHSMTQMMQMQMQWMQQMTAMMQQNPNMQMPTMGMPGMPPIPPQHGPPSRPQSVPLQNMNAPNQRTMSTLSPNMAGWAQSSPAVPQMNGHNNMYAHSIAPSERSNVGLASRYRPVSTIAPEQEPNWAKRSSTFTTSTFRPWANENRQSKLGTSTVRAIQPTDDDDDEQGWAEMKARKEKKQRTWKLRKGGNRDTLQELYNAPA